MTTQEEELLRKLRETFRAEAAEHIQTLNETLLHIERDSDTAHQSEAVHDAFRTAHSLKGAARAVDWREIESVAHAVENVLQKTEAAGLALTPATCDVLYDALDAVQTLLEEQSVELEPLLARLADLVERGPVRAARAAPAQQSSPQSQLQPEPESPATPSSSPEDTVDTPSESEPAPHAARAQTSPAEETIRVSLRKLDDLMAQAGELVVAKISAEQRLVEMQGVRQRLTEWPKNWREIQALMPQVLEGSAEAGQQLNEVLSRLQDYLQEVTRDVNTLDHAIGRDTLQLGMVASGLQGEVRRVRMVPFQTLSMVLKRAVRDVAYAEGKQAALEITGGEVEMDKRVLESLKDPLLHLMRNAVSHGIESPEVRAADGKPAEGQVQIALRQRGGEVHITVKDDGCGFDIDRLRAAATRHNGGALEDADEAAVIATAFQSGVTTADRVTAVSGRGVGLDVVRQRLEALNGRIQVDTAPGEGATLRMVVPVSLTITHGLLVQVGTESYALPLLSVVKIIEPEDVFTVENRTMITVDEVPLPLVALGDVLERPSNGDRLPENPLAVVINVAEQELALLVDDVINEQELVIKPLGEPLRRVRNVSGAALLGTGRPVAILNPADLILSAKGAKMRSMPSNGRAVGRNGKEQKMRAAHILVVDDSITTRTLEKNILEAAGYRVTTATDGLEAFQRLKDGAIDLIVADIQMPNMDGIAFTRRLRESTEYRDFPVILVTSLESREDREAGMRAGADAYIIKRGFDQAELLATIEQYL